MSGRLVTTIVTTILSIVVTSCNFESMMEIQPMITVTPKVEVTTMPTPTLEIVVTQPAIVVTSVTTMCKVLTGVPEGFLNLREGAGVEYPVVTTIQEGSELEYSGRVEKGWMFVTQGDSEGWVNSLYVGGCDVE